MRYVKSAKKAFKGKDGESYIDVTKEAEELGLEHGEMMLVYFVTPEMERVFDKMLETKGHAHPYIAVFKDSSGFRYYLDAVISRNELIGSLDEEPFVLIGPFVGVPDLNEFYGLLKKRKDLKTPEDFERFFMDFMCSKEGL